MKPSTIFDVARLAGVSKGTVDRVLHERGQVSRSSREKVLRAAEVLDYRPNLYAAVLGMKSTRTIACLLPECSKGEYWDKIRQGFLKGSQEVSQLNIETSIFTYDQYDESSFVNACYNLLDAGPDGVVLPPLFGSSSLMFAGKLQQEGIPYVFVDARLPEDNGYIAFYGMPMYESGVLCARLLTERLSTEQVRDILTLRIKRDANNQSDPTAPRREGFNDFMREHFPSCTVHSIFIDTSRPETIETSLDEYFTSGLDTSLVVMFNSRIHLVATYLAAHPCPGRRVIGYDDLDANLEVLRNSSVDCIISQHTEKQSFLAVSTLADYILTHKKPDERDNFMHMDILTRFNMDNYQSMA